jgi:hypothetical protein
MFQKILRLSILSGAGPRIPSESLNCRDSLEHFVTHDTVISVIENHYIVIRTVIGSTVYIVEDFTSPHQKEIIELPMNGHDCFGPPNDVYRSAVSWDEEFSTAVEGLDANLSQENEFLPYSPPTPRRTPSPAHSLLSDLGFFSKSTWETIRRVPPDLFGELEKFDLSAARPTSRIFMLQILSENPSGPLSSKDTPALRAVIEDLKLGLEGCAYSFVVPALDEKKEAKNSISYAVQVGFVVILNESGLTANSQCPALKEFDCALVIDLMEGEEYCYRVEFFCHDLGIFGNCQISDLVWKLKKGDLAAFVAIAIYLFLTTPPSVLPNGSRQVRGPDHFIVGLYHRGMRIAQIFEKSEAGRNAILLGCLGCTLQQNVGSGTF